jgi:Xaa-Pro dipeptidase
MRAADVQENEIVAFDTDLIGCLRLLHRHQPDLVDRARPAAPRHDQALRHALDHIREHGAAETRRALPRAGLRRAQLDAEHERAQVQLPLHGVGLCDEWPYIAYPDGYVEGAFDAVLEPGMTLCVEALVGEEGATSRSSWRTRC